MMDDFSSIIGAAHDNVQHDSSVKHVTGKAVYIDDITLTEKPSRKGNIIHIIEEILPGNSKVGNPEAKSSDGISMWLYLGLGLGWVGLLLMASIIWKVRMIFQSRQ